MSYDRTSPSLPSSHDAGTLAATERRPSHWFVLMIALWLTAGAASGLPVPSEPSLAWVDGRRLMLQKRNPDGTLAPAEPFVIRGVNYSPASPSTLGENEARRAEFSLWAATDPPLMAAMNVNTVRVYLDPGLDAAGLAILDELYANGIMAIVTVDDGVHDLARLQQAVAFYKDHPAVLLWMLGSEWNINLYFGNPACSTVEQAAECTEAAAQLVKSLDSNHPVATSYGDIDIDAPGMRLADTADYVNNVAPTVDVWSLNVYRAQTFGDLFEQWASISGKPMFLGEFGTDALYNAAGLVDETMQAHWDLCLWHDLMAELSADHPALPALGGIVFEWNDEWWKVPPSGSQENGGFFLSGGHPDDFANEEFFGLVDIGRTPRRAAEILGAAFAAAYAAPPRGLALGAVSRGSAAAQWPGQFGVTRYYRCGEIFHEVLGGGGGGRGLNVVALDPVTGAELAPPRNFDTYGTRSLCAQDDAGAALTALVAFLDSLAEGTLVMLSAADEAGLNQDDSCLPFASSTCYDDGLAALEALGSTRIRDYCFRDSWAMIAVKGQGSAIDENLASGEEVSVLAGLPDPGTFSLSVSKAGDGGGTVTSDPPGIACAGGCSQTSMDVATGTPVALAGLADAGSLFLGLSGDVDCTNGVVTVDRDTFCVATFCRDSDNDSVCDTADLCQGDDATGDGDGDGVCADRDCDDNNPSVSEVDGCGVCGGDNSSCLIFSDGFESGDATHWSSRVP